MQMKDIAFAAPASVEALRQLSRKNNLAPYDLGSFDLKDTQPLGTQDPRLWANVGSFNSFNAHIISSKNTFHLVVKPGASLIGKFPKHAGVHLTDENISEILAQEPSNFTFRDTSKLLLAFEQYARERLPYLLACAIGLQDVHAPVFPCFSGHSSFYLCGSLVMGPQDQSLNLISKDQNDPLWWLEADKCHEVMVPILRDIPQLWSLMSANLIFRGFVGDRDHNPGAYVLTYDQNSKKAAYTIDAGGSFFGLNDENVPLSKVLMGDPLIGRCINSSLVTQGAPDRFDEEIMCEVAENIYRMPSDQIREIVTGVFCSLPFPVLQGELQTVDRVCLKLEESRQMLAEFFVHSIEETNRETDLNLFRGRFPDMPGKKASPPKARRPSTVRRSARTKASG